MLHSLEAIPGAGVVVAANGVVAAANIQEIGIREMCTITYPLQFWRRWLHQQ